VDILLALDNDKLGSLFVVSTGSESGGFQHLFDRPLCQYR